MIVSSRDSMMGVEGDAHFMSELIKTSITNTIVEVFDSDPAVVDAAGRRIVKAKQIYTGKLFDADTPVDVLFDRWYVNKDEIAIQASDASAFSYTVDDTDYTTPVELIVSEYMFDESGDYVVGARIIVHMKVADMATLPTLTVIPGDPDGRKFSRVTGTLVFTVSGLCIKGGNITYVSLEPPIDGSNTPGTPVNTVPTPIDPANISIVVTFNEKNIYAKVSWPTSPNALKYELDIAEGVADPNVTPSETDFADTDPAPQYVTTTWTTFNGLVANAFYWIRLRTVSVSGQHSDWKMKWFAVIPPDGSGDKNVLAPTDLVASSYLFRQIMLTWKHSASIGVTGYNVYRSTSLNGTYTRIATKVRDPFYYDTPNKDDWTVFFYYVTAVGAFGNESPPSNKVSGHSSGITDLSVEAGQLYDRLTDGGVLSGKIAKAAITADKLYAGVLTSYNATVVNRFKGCTVVFSELAGSNGTYVTWTTGTITLSKATYATGADKSASDVTWGTISPTISNGNFGGFTPGYLYYAYVTYAVDATTKEPTGTPMSVMVSSIYPTGLYDIILATIAVDANGKISIEPGVATGTVINGDHISTGSITAKCIKANSITADLIAAGQIDVTKLNFVPVTGGNVVASINASAEGLTISGSKVQINGSTMFTSDSLPYTTSISLGSKANADMSNVTTIDGGKIRTGSITSQDGRSTISMINGTFSFGSGALAWDGSLLTTTGKFQSILPGSGQRIEVGGASTQGYVRWYDMYNLKLSEISQDGNTLYLSSLYGDLNLSAKSGSVINCNAGIVFAYSKGISFNGSTLYSDGAHLYFKPSGGNTITLA